MEFPEKCPNCGKKFGDYEAYLLQRAEPEWDSDKPDRIEDSISECSNCHSLFRLKWKLVSFEQLVPKSGLGAKKETDEIIVPTVDCVICGFNPCRCKQKGCKKDD